MSKHLVLILVLMECAAAASLNEVAGNKWSLNPCSNGMRGGKCQARHRYGTLGLNPCSNGMRGGTTTYTSRSRMPYRLNPCSNGMRGGRLIFSAITISDY